MHKNKSKTIIQLNSIMKMKRTAEEADLQDYNQLQPDLISISENGERIVVLQAPRGCLGLYVSGSERGAKICRILDFFFARHVVQEGDYILQINGVEVAGWDTKKIGKFLNDRNNEDRELMFLSFPSGEKV